MRILAVDYGTVRVGLAVSDPTGWLAQGLSVVKRKSDNQVIEEIRSLVRDREISEIVVGLPKNMNGSLGERAQQCSLFADKLRKALEIPVVLHDERLTTVSAERILIEADVRREKRKQVIDSVAATILLQSYLDGRQSKNDRLWD